MTKMMIFKICRRAEWPDPASTGLYGGSADDLRDGFIHLSTADQLAETLAKHFRDIDDLLLIAFETEDLADTLRWEASRGGQLFPHVYGPLDPDLAKWIKPLPLGPAGHVIPELDRP